MTEPNRLFGQPDAALIQVCRDAYEAGFNIGMERGSDEFDPNVARDVGAAAEADAYAHGAWPYDPRQPADRLAEDDYTRTRDEEGKAQHAMEHTRAALRAREMERAAMGDEPEVPSSPIVVAILVTLGVSLTTMPTLHDVFFARLFVVPNQAIVASALCGIALAAALTSAIFSSAKLESAVGTWAAIATAALFGVAFVCLRLAAGNVLLAIGLALIEAACLVVAERYARALRMAWATYRTQRAAYAIADEQVGAAQKQYDERREELADCRQRIAAHRAMVTSREDAARAAMIAATLARDCAVRGYRQALAHVHGRLYGTTGRPPSRDDVIAAILSQRALKGRSGK